jgi:DNA-binding protein HU-beta
MATERTSFEAYRSLSDEEREIVRAEAALDWLQKRKPAASAKPRVMTRTQLVATLADQLGVDRKLAVAALESLARIVAAEVAAGGSVALPGLGKFAARAKPERAAAGGKRPAKDDPAVSVTVARELRNAVEN